MKKYLSYGVNLVWIILLQACQPQVANDNKIPQNANDSSKIINGLLLDATQLPQMARLYSGGGSCSATLVGPNVVITAAHCWDGFTIQFFGPINGVYYKANVTAHPDFAQVSETDTIARLRDVAIGILEKEVVGVAPATIASSLPTLGSRVLFAGCGWPEISVRKFGFSNVSIVGTSSFTMKDLALNPSGDQHLGQGDSGGPNFSVNGQNEISLFGVSSTGLLFSSEGVASVVNIETNANSVWINKFIADHDLKVCGINMTCDALALIPNGFKNGQKLEFSFQNKTIEVIHNPIFKAVFPTSIFSGPVIYIGLGNPEDLVNINVKDKIVLVQRGGKTITQKMDNARKAGAKAVIIFNDEANKPVFTLDFISSFPIVAIQHADGLELVKHLVAGEEVTVDFSDKVTEYHY